MRYIVLRDHVAPRHRLTEGQEIDSSEFFAEESDLMLDMGIVEESGFAPGFTDEAAAQRYAAGEPVFDQDTPAHAAEEHPAEEPAPPPK